MGQINTKLRSVGSGSIGHWCPGCEEMHVIRIVGAGKWDFDGNNDKPTFSPSVLVTYDGKDAGQALEGGDWAPPARCHYFLRQGVIDFLADCTHELAGKSVDLPDLPAHCCDEP